VADGLEADVVRLNHATDYAKRFPDNASPYASTMVFKVRKELRRWLRRLHDEMNISSVSVTHDQEEALEVANRVVVMNRGRIEQIGSPDEVYSSPASPFVYQFLGNVNVFHSRLHGAWAEVVRDGEAGEPGSIAFVRPHDIELDRQPIEGGMQAVVSRVHRIGPLVRVELEHQGETIEVELTRERAARLEPAAGVSVWLKPRQAKVFSEANGAPAFAPEDKQPFLF